MRLVWIAAFLLSLHPASHHDQLSIELQGRSIAIIHLEDYIIPGTSLVNLVKLPPLLNDLDHQITQKPVNAYIGDNGQIIPEQPGYKLNRQEFIKQFMASFKAMDSGKLELPRLQIHANVDSEMLGQIREKPIGSYATYYNSYNINRAHNIALASKAINNQVVFPGESFSFNQTVGKRTTEKGYLRAAVIVSGELSEGIGGGICQVSSTLFNSADRAGLKITQRYSHSRNVAYVPSGRDATVSWDGPDFTFLNPYNQPILIRAWAGSGTITITLFSSHMVEHKPRGVPGAAKQLPQEISAGLELTTATSPKIKSQGIAALSVRSSLNSSWQSTLALDNREILQALENAKEEAAKRSSFGSDIYLSLQTFNLEKHYRMDSAGNIWDESQTNQLIIPSKLSLKLLSYAEALRKVHYGRMVSWHEAKQIIPIKSSFAITDLETGLTFRVQRRAGKDHADVQPLTKKDSEIMHKIYHDWSWKRKAILVHTDHEWLAASMNGMPHGGDGIPGNGFSGHFCVHFFQSSTHKSPEPDLAHQLMVYKAAGHLGSFLKAAPPAIIAESFIEAFNQDDPELLQHAAYGIPKDKIAFFLEEMKTILSIKIIEKQIVQEESLSAIVQLATSVYQKGHSKRNVTYSFIFSRDSSQDAWHLKDVL